MIRVLTMIAFAGFVLSVGCLTAAVAIGGPDAISRGAWGWVDGHEGNWGWSHGHSRRHSYDREDRWADDGGDGGQVTTRSLAWSGADHLDLDLAADVRYVQTPGGAGTVELTGPARALEHVTIDGDSIRYDRGYRHHWAPKLTIVIHAPNIAAFDISGLNSLAIEGYNQKRLTLDASGESEVTVTGEADELRLQVTGAGDVDMTRLKLKGADVDISGSADVTIAPTDWASLDVSGMADVRLLTHPAKLETDISGAGKVRQDGAGAPSPSPSPTPSPSPSPSPKGAKT